MPSLAHVFKATPKGALVAYYGTLVVLLAASRFPEYRVWGLNWWAYFPGFVPFILFLIGAALPVALAIWLRRVPTFGLADADAGGSSRTYLLIAVFLTMAFGLAFYVLRTTTHFLGDGYTVLSLLADDNPLVKERELGEALVHIWVKWLIGGDSQRAALLSFRIISISAGVLFVLTAILAAYRLFPRTIDRALFLVGVTSGGYMLLFFGYVENYSLFVLLVGVYTLVGLLASAGIISRWYVIPAAAFAVFSHIMGASLIPSSLYVLIAGSRIGHVIGNAHRGTKALAAFLVAAGVFAISAYYYSENLFFRFAILPLAENRFTLEGYTLLSWQHLADYANLLLLLSPGFVVVGAALLLDAFRPRWNLRQQRYLLILLVSTAGAAFVFDPKLGMPRDWDLYAFWGVPLLVLSYYVLLQKRAAFQGGRVAILAIALSCLSLGARVGALTSAEVSIAHLQAYFDLDRAKNRAGRMMLIAYYQDIGDSTRAAEEIRLRDQDFPERSMFWQAHRLKEDGQLTEAIELFRRVIDVNPTIAEAWANLGECYMRLGQFESSIYYFSIALGLNPWGASSYNNLGVCYSRLGNYDKADDALRKSCALDPTGSQPFYNRAINYRLSGQMDRYHRHLVKAAYHDSAQADAVKELIEHYLSVGKYDSAAVAIDRAHRRGLDSNYISQLRRAHPQLPD